MNHLMKMVNWSKRPQFFVICFDLSVRIGVILLVRSAIQYEFQISPLPNHELTSSCVKLKK